MAVIKRQWRTWLAVVALLAGVFLLWDRDTFGHTPGDETIIAATTFASLDGGAHDADLLVNNSVTIAGNLTVAAGGSITCNDPALPTAASACPITLIVTGDLEIQAGGSIHAENTIDGGLGGDIAITVGGDFTMRGPSGGNPGAIISSRKLSGGSQQGGDIEIVVGGVTLDTSVDPAIGVCNTPDGDILIEEGATITSDSDSGRAGDIALYAGRNITIHGTVRAQGSTTIGHGGAITIDACCDLFIGDTGVVSSQGQDPGPDRVHLEGCVVTIFGLVQSTGPGHAGAQPLCTPPIRPGKPAISTGCLEIWSGTTLTIDSTGTHKGEVHADVGFAGGSSGQGWIDLLANGNILINDGAGNDGANLLIPSPATNHAVHANMFLGNGRGGDIAVQSKAGSASTFGDAIQANNTAAGGGGGNVKVEAGGVGSPAGDVLFDAASIQAMGANGGGGTQNGGTIKGRSFMGDLSGTGGELNADGGAGQAVPQPGSVTLEACLGATYTGASTPAFVLGVNDLVCVGMPTLPSPADTLLPSSNCVQFCTLVTPTPTPTNTPPPTVTPTPGVSCPEDPNRAAQLTRTVDLSKPNLSGGGVPGNPKNYLLVQSAYDAAKVSAQAEVVGLFANTSENLVLNGSKSLTITQCTVARVTGAAGSPVWDITSTGKLTIIGPDSVGGSIGWRVGGNGGHNLKSVRANGASQYGILIGSNGNSVSWNNVSGNGPGAGIRVTGNSNILKGGTVGPNNGDGVQLIGNSNTLSGATIQSNTGNGVLVAGSTNQVKSNSRINLNGLDGILVTGSSNTLSSNASESGKGNTQSGIAVTGNTNQLTDNKMNTNAVGYRIFGTGNKLKSNNTSNNTGNEYEIGAGNVDQLGNKKNGSGFTFTNAGGNFN